MIGMIFGGGLVLFNLYAMLTNHGTGTSVFFGLVAGVGIFYYGYKSWGKKRKAREK